MAKSFACRDIGMSCGFKTSADSEKELMDKIVEHARGAHGMAKIDKKTMSAVRSAIRDEDEK